jgi:hypothetical protein
MLQISPATGMIKRARMEEKTKEKVSRAPEKENEMTYCSPRTAQPAVQH